MAKPRVSFAFDTEGASHHNTAFFDGLIDNQIDCQIKAMRCLSQIKWGVAKLVRPKVLILVCAGSSPATPAIYLLEADCG